MSMDILEKIFGSSARVKIMRLFLFNSEEELEKSEIASRSKVQPQTAQKELGVLESAGMIKKITFTKDHETKTGKISKKKVTGYKLNQDFKYLSFFQNLLVNTDPLQHEEIASKISRTGKIKLVLLSGIFIQAPDSRVDMLIVGNEMKPKSLQSAISVLEAEIGKELRYTVLSLEDFKYRQSICDRLIRDVFDGPYKVIVDKTGLI